MAYTKTFEFTAAVRGYHYYRRFWIPQPAQHLNCSHESDNPFDQFAIKICETGCETPIGHLPREISRATKCFSDRGAVVNAILTGEHYRRSPLQGGLEIPCVIKVSIPGTCLNLLLMERYKELIAKSYTEPKKEEIIGSYLRQQPLLQTPDLEKEPRRANKKQTTENKSEEKSKDIRMFFCPSYCQ